MDRGLLSLESSKQWSSFVVVLEVRDASDEISQSRFDHYCSSRSPRDLWNRILANFHSVRLLFFFSSRNLQTPRPDHLDLKAAVGGPHTV
nr:hypothetical protein CFP56_29930 [Quercus suber]